MSTTACGNGPDHRRPARIAAECGDVVSDPPQCEQEIAHGPVPVVIRRGRDQVPEDAQAVIDSHHDHPELSQASAVVPASRSRTTDERSSVDEDQNGQVLSFLGRPDADEERVLLLWVRFDVAPHHQPEATGRLRKDRRPNSSILRSVR